jgi:pimeloyl-ACP methyl ester carboxylesterase
MLHRNRRHFLADLARGTLCAGVGLVTASAVGATATKQPKPTGELVELGGHRLHVRCAGKGSPLVIVECGLGDFSFDWVLVQSRVAGFTRICTYDRGGYAWSDPGPRPRTFAQLNLELHDALGKLCEHGPLVLVGHSFGGPVARNFAARYPREVAGMVLVDSVHEGQRVAIQGKAVRLSDGAKGKPIPPPREDMRASDKPVLPAASAPDERQALHPVYQRLPRPEQELHRWAQVLPHLEDAESSQREWSTEYYANMVSNGQAGSLGAIPLVILSRAEGGYGDKLDIPAAQLERERKDGQAQLARLSTNSRQVFVRSGHNMHLEAPDEVAAAIREVVEAVRQPLKH